MLCRIKIILFFILFCSFCTRSDYVSEVIDGDTFRTEKGETVRLLGINAPEIGEPGADLAFELLDLLIAHKDVRLIKDITDHDDYGRLLRYVYVDTIFVNAELVRAGVVEVRCYPPDTAYQKELKQLEKIAIRNKKGLWAFRVFQAPDTNEQTSQTISAKISDNEMISWRDAAHYYGQIKTVQGRIVATHNTGKVCFLNFHKDWKKCFTAVIFSSDFNKFPPHPEDYYLNRKVRVQGLIKEYKGKPEIILKDPKQIMVID